jgi:hypothetical protein
VIFLAGEAVYLMKDVIAEAIDPVVMPPLGEMRRRFVAPKVFAERVE